MAVRSYPVADRTAWSESEKQWQAGVITLAKMLGWKHMHHWRSDRSPEGWPDLFLVRGEMALAWELKVGSRRLSPAQREWLTMLDRVPGISSALVRPDPPPKSEVWTGALISGIEECRDRLL